jgi:hypothetical protein
VTGTRSDLGNATEKFFLLTLSATAQSHNNFKIEKMEFSESNFLANLKMPGEGERTESKIFREIDEEKYPYLVELK